MTIVTTQELAAILRCHPETIYRHCRTPEHAGGIPRLRLGPQLRFDVDRVVEWMQTRAEQPGRVAATLDPRRQP